MSDYISVPLETDPEVLRDNGFLVMEDAIDGWEASIGQLDVLMIGATAEIVAEARDVASDVPTTIYRDFGTNIMNIPSVDEASASVTSTWTAVDSDGHTIPQGTLVILTNDEGLQVPFLVSEDVIINAGSATTTSGGVTLIADDNTGSDGNGCSNSPTPELVDSLFWVDTITIVGTSSGGEDAEEDSEYLNRLTSELQLLAPRPILAQDFAVLALRIPGVGRASAIDNYNLDTSTAGVEKCVTVIVTDEDGEAVATGVKDDVDAMLEAQREVNFLVFVGDATYNTINVTYVATAMPDWDIADVESRADSALSDFFSPLGWGLPAGENTFIWQNKVRIRIQELYTVLNNVQGLDYVTTLTFQIGAGANDGTDKDMTGIAPLPQIGTITSTVNAP